MSVALGGQAALSFTVADASGTLVDPATATVSIVQPDGTSVVLTLAGGTLTRTAVGTFTAYWAPTMVGWHQWQGSSTGPATATLPDSVTVVGATASTAAPLVSLQEVRTHLRISSPIEDSILLRMALTATEICEGPKGTNQVWRRLTKTETLDILPGQSAIMLTKRPVISVTSITEAGTTLSSGTDFLLDGPSGFLIRGTATGPLSWYPGNQIVTVTYVAGVTGAIPEAVRQGVLEMTKHLYDTQRGGAMAPRQSGPDQTWDPRMGYTIPRRVKELWQGQKRTANL